MTELGPDEARKIARLSKLELPDADVAETCRRLSAVLTHMDCLSRLDLDGVEPMAHVEGAAGSGTGDNTGTDDGVGGGLAPLRDDTPGETTDTETAVGLAPASYEIDDPAGGTDEDTGEPRKLRFIRVPKVIGDGGGP